MEENKINKSNKIKITVLTFLILLVSVAGISYAYFTIQITGNDTASSMRLRTANMSLIYNDVQIVSGEYVTPGWSDTKTLTVTNNGNVNVYYSIIWRDLVNEILNGELVISATCASSVTGNTCEGISETSVPLATSETHGVLVDNGIMIEPGETHTYTLTAEFIDTGSNQNYNQNKYFNGTLNIGEGDAPISPSLLKYTIENGEVTITGSKFVSVVDQTACKNYVKDYYACQEGDSDCISNAEQLCETGRNDWGEFLTSLVNNTLASEYETAGIQFNASFPSDLVIPSTIEGYPVTSIDDYAFFINKLTSVIIPDGVTVIGMESFSSNQLTSIKISNSVTTIEQGAFANNQLSSVTIPSSVTSIGFYAFGSNQLTSVTIPNSITTMGEWVFGDNQLTFVAIPSSITTISEGLFGNNQLTSVIIPNSVTSIGSRAFSSNQLTSVTIPNSVTTIGEGAFQNNKLTSISIPNSVTTINSWAFYDNQLTSVTIPNSVTSIGSRAFTLNKLPDDSAYIYKRTDTNHDGIAEIDYTTVICYGGASKTPTIPSNITKIDIYAFYNNKLTSVTIPNSVTTIGQGAFHSNQLTTVTIPSSVTSLGQFSFGSNKLTSVIIEGKSSSSGFTGYTSNIWGWASGVTCVKNNTSNVTNGCITWNGS